MARYVLIEFDSDAQADAFVNRTITKSIGGAAYHIRGYFAKPTKFCECGPIPESRMGKELTRGAKYGWLVHRKCRRPRPGSQSPRNLLDPTNTPARQLTAFLSLSGEWDKTRPVGTPISNYPIVVANE